MMIDFYWHAYKYFAYEHRLAEREVESLIGQRPERGPKGLIVEDIPNWQQQAHRTTYFSSAGSSDGTNIVPLQANLEHSANFLPQTGLPVLAPVLSRQSTRYSAHGLHEYRGKFNPQIVRAIGNILHLQPGDSILDPFCGSGTTILEAIHNGWSAVGIDANPLAVQIARAKVAAMQVPLGELSDLTQRVVERLDERFAGIPFDKAFPIGRYKILAGKDWELMLPNIQYLRRWFRESVLIQLSAILQEITIATSPDVRLVLGMVLSDILRSVSMQDPADLRIRRLKNPPENAPAVPLFLSTALSKVEQILRARAHLGTVTGNQTVLQEDAREFSDLNPGIAQQYHFAAAITSPPYATALPYIDTQRLSLVLLGHIGNSDLHTQDQKMIGNREIQSAERDRINQQMDSMKEELPAECLALCRSLRAALRNDIDGFRRQNTPALLYKYLTDMSAMFRQVRTLLEPGTPYALVVGRNVTTLGGTTFVIDTPNLLSVLANANGFSLGEIIELDTYQRYDIHQANSIRTECLVILKVDGNAN